MFGQSHRNIGRKNVEYVGSSIVLLRHFADFMKKLVLAIFILSVMTTIQLAINVYYPLLSMSFLHLLSCRCYMI